MLQWEILVFPQYRSNSCLAQTTELRESLISWQLNKNSNTMGTVRMLKHVTGIQQHAWWPLEPKITTLSYGIPELEQMSKPCNPTIRSSIRSDGTLLMGIGFSQVRKIWVLKFMILEWWKSFSISKVMTTRSPLLPGILSKKSSLSQVLYRAK